MKLFYSLTGTLCSYITELLPHFKNTLHRLIDDSGTCLPKILKVAGVLPVTLVCFQFVCLAQESRESGAMSGEETATDMKRMDGKTEPYSIERFPKIKYNIENIQVPKLLVGDTLPEQFWETTIWLVHPDDGRDEKVSLKSFRDKKLIILDFWATWCSPCVGSINDFHDNADIFNRQVALLLGHIDFDYKALPFMQKENWKAPSLIGKSARVVQKYFFDQIAAGGVVWIIDGVVRAIEYNNDENIKKIPLILAGEKVELTSW